MTDSSFYWPLLLGIIVVAAAAASSGYGLVRWVLRAASKSADGGEPQDDAEQAKTLRGGTWIGILERIGVVVTIMAGHPAGIAYIVAIKGLGRYPELKNHPEVSERFVIGTLASILWAALLGGAGVAAVRAIWPVL